MATLIGTAPDQVPVNGMLGDLAFQNIDSVKVINLTYTDTLTGGTGILNIGSGQVYKDASGNVGIGTSSPSTKLTVAGAITITGAFALRGSYGAGAIVSNFAAGDGALIANTTGYQNSAMGVSALQNNTTGNQNSAVGVSALLSNTTDRKSTRLNSSHTRLSRMPSSA